MNIDEQQAVVVEVMRPLIDFIDRRCRVAGGAPRDWYFNKEARDIDIYLRCNAVSNILEFLSIFLECQVEEAVEVDVSKYTVNQKLSINNIITFKYKDVEFQLIIIEGDPETVGNSFCLDICDISAVLDGDSIKIKTTRAFREAVAKEVITLRPGFSGGLLEEYVMKVAGYFPDFEVIRVEAKINIFKWRFQ